MPFAHQLSGGGFPKALSLEVMADCPWAYWRFGESAIPSAPSLAYDASGNNRHATPVNSPTFGVVGCAYNDTDTAVRTSSAAANHLTVPARGSVFTQWTVEGWVRMSSPAVGAPVMFTDRYNNNSINMMVGFDTGTYNVCAGMYTYPSPGWVQTGRYTLTQNKWHHVVATFDGSTMILYVDGISRSSVGVSQTIGTGNLGYRIGQRWDLPDSMDGSIDEVAIYTYPLSPERILAHYNGATQGSPANLGNLATWLAADSLGSIPDGSVIPTLYDRGLSVSDAGQVTSSKRPTLVRDVLNGKPVLRFSAAASQEITSLPNYTGVPQWTIYAVGRYRSGTHGRIVSSNFGATAGNWLMGWWGNNIDQAYYEGWVAGPFGPTDNNWHLYSGKGDGSSGYLYNRGNLVSSSGSHTGPNGFAIGSVGGGEYSDCDFAELIGFTASHNDADRHAVEYYLANKYNL